MKVTKMIHNFKYEIHLTAPFGRNTGIVILSDTLPQKVTIDGCEYETNPHKTEWIDEEKQYAEMEEIPF